MVNCTDDASALSSAIPNALVMAATYPDSMQRAQLSRQAFLDMAVPVRFPTTITERLPLRPASPILL